VVFETAGVVVAMLIFAIWDGAEDQVGGLMGAIGDEQRRASLAGSPANQYRVSAADSYSHCTSTTPLGEETQHTTAYPS